MEWAVLITAALIAIRQFYVQELIAAFVIFSVLFACLAAVVAGGALMIFFVDRAGQIAFAWAEVYTRAFARLARRGWENAGTWSGKAFGISREPPARSEQATRSRGEARAS